MNQLVTLPLAATPIAAFSFPSPAKADGDARIFQIAADLAELDVLCRQRCDEMDECDVGFEYPKRPDVLRYRFGDDVQPVDNGKTVDGKFDLWCNEDDIDRLRGRTEFYRWCFTGTKEEWDKHGLNTWRNNEHLPPGVPNELFLSLEHDHRKQRAAELIAALDAYREAYDKAMRESGLLAAEEAYNEATDRRDALIDEMMSLNPTTLEGVKVIASTIVQRCWYGQISPQSIEGDKEICALLSHLTDVEMKRAA